MVSAIAYLFSEFALRPVAARALSGEERLHVRGLAYADGCCSSGASAPGAGPGLVVVAILALTRRDVSLTKLAVVVLVLGGVVLLFGLLVTGPNARAVVAPIIAVRHAMEQVEEGDLDAEVQVYDGTELGQLQAGFNEMVARAARARAPARPLRAPRRHATWPRRPPRDVELGGETRVVSVLFVDIIGSTTLATERTPAEVVELLNRFFGVVVEEVDRHDGLVNKFIGDAALAIFGAPVELEDHAGQALAAGRAMAAGSPRRCPSSRPASASPPARRWPATSASESRFEYTVIGDAVNAAARLTELAKDVDRPAARRLGVGRGGRRGRGTHWKQHDTVTLRGRSTETVLARPRTADSGRTPPTRGAR